jgi:hypothetical protein
MIRRGAEKENRAERGAALGIRGTSTRRDKQTCRREAERSEFALGIAVSSTRPDQTLSGIAERCYAMGGKTRREDTVLSRTAEGSRVPRSASAVRRRGRMSRRGAEK